MASVKLILKQSQILKNDSCPIIIQVIKDRKKVITTLNLSCHINDWNFKTNLPKNNRLSLICQKRLLKMQELLFEGEEKEWSAKKIVNIFSGKERKDPLFFEYYRSISFPDQKGMSTINALVTHMNRFEEFLKKDIPLSQVTFEVLNEYYKHLGAMKSKHRYFASIRQVYDHAVEYDVFIPRKRPFKKHFFKKNIETLNKNISIEDVKKIFKHEVQHQKYRKIETQQLVLDIWKLSFLLRGINFVDVVLIKKNNINDYYVYTRQKLKTRTTVKLKVKVFPEAQEIIDRYNGEYLFPIVEGDINENKWAYNDFIKRRAIISRNMKRLGKTLKIDMDLTTTTPRYSFINIAKELGVPFLYLQELMGHKTMSTTDIYLDAFPQSQIDDYHRKVIDAVI